MPEFIIITKSKNIILVKHDSGEFVLYRTKQTFTMLSKEVKIKAVYKAPQGFTEKHSGKSPKEFIKALKETAALCYGGGKNDKSR